MTFIYFVEIDLGGGNYLRYTSFDKSLVLDGSLYIPKPLRITGFAERSKVEPPQIILELSNVDLLSSEIDTEALLGCRTKLILAQEELLHDSTTFINFEFWIEAVTYTEQRMEIELTNRMELLDVEIPRFRFSRLCRWVFKGPECRYTGTETSCDKTRETCRTVMDNFRNFGGFPSVPKRPLVGGI